jgi:hypothetical protein
LFALALFAHVFSWFFFIYFGALALTTLVLLFMTRGYYAVSSSINTNEIAEKSSHYNYYCEAGLCKTGVSHIGCINKGRFGQKCTKDARVIQLDDYQKRLILHSE